MQSKENKLFVGVAGYDTIAMPIVVVCCKFNAISLKFPALYRQLRKNFNSPYKQRMQVLQESDLDYRAAFIYPDELEQIEKRTKVANSLSNVVIQQFYNHSPSEICISRDVPSVSSGQSFLPITKVTSLMETNLANYQAQILREPYIIKAHQSFPQYEFNKNRGEAKYTHYLSILRYGLSRHHHPLPSQVFYNLFRDLSLKGNPILTEFYPYYLKSPKWWIDHYGTPLKDMFNSKMQNRIEDTSNYLLKQKKLANKLDNSEMARYLSPLFKEPPKEFIEWVEKNKPEENNLWEIF